MPDEQTPVEPFQVLEPSQEQIDDYYKDQKERRKRELDEIIKDFEPWDITDTDLEGRFHEDLESIEKTENIEQKRIRLSIIIEETKEIMGNLLSAYPYLLERGIIAEDVNIGYLQQYAKNFIQRMKQKRRRLSIVEPTVKTSTKQQDDVKTGSKVSSIPEISKHESSKSENYLTREEAAKKLRVSKDALSRLPMEMRNKFKIGGKFVILESRLPELEEALKSKTQADEKSEPEPKVNTNRKYYFSFKEPHLELFTNVLVKEGYLDKADQMINRFSKGKKMKKDMIKWKNDASSLLTFLYISDMLGYIAINGPKTQGHFGTSSALIQANDETEEQRKIIDVTDEVLGELPYFELTETNFIGVNGKSVLGCSEGNVSKIIKRINLDVIHLCRQIYNKNGKEPLTRRKAIKYYFENKDEKFEFNRDKNEEIDKKMLKIIREDIYPEIKKIDK
jgi:hypothetical protein